LYGYDREESAEWRNKFLVEVKCLGRRSRGMNWLRGFLLLEMRVRLEELRTEDGFSQLRM
jgi:hypothetical protein